MMTLEQLRAFVAVAEELHFGRAAERLRITQPPLSRQIQRLEAEIKTPLFERTNRSVRLTAAGEALIDEARRLLALAEAATDRARRAAAGIEGHLAVGFTATAALGILGALLDELDTYLPGVEVSLHEHVSAEQLDRLDDGGLDLSLLRSPPQDPQHASRVIHRERLVAAIPARSPLALGRTPVRPQEFEDTPVIGYARPTAAYFDDLASAIFAGVRVRHLERISQVNTITALVSTGRGSAVVPESAMRLRPEGVVFRRIAGWEEAIAELWAVWRSDSANPALERTIRALPTMRQATSDAR